jgi:hypothetical protein
VVLLPFLYLFALFASSANEKPSSSPLDWPLPCFDHRQKLDSQLKSHGALIKTTTAEIAPSRKIIINNFMNEDLILGDAKTILITTRLSISSLKPDSSLGMNGCSGSTSYRLFRFWLFMTPPFC